MIVYSPSAAESPALGQISNTVTHQTAIMSYNNAFILTLVVFFCTLPAVLLLNPPKPGVAAGGDMY